MLSSEFWPYVFWFLALMAAIVFVALILQGRCSGCGRFWVMRATDNYKNFKREWVCSRCDYSRFLPVSSNEPGFGPDL